MTDLQRTRTPVQASSSLPDLPGNHLELFAPSDLSDLSDPSDAPTSEEGAGEGGGAIGAGDERKLFATSLVEDPSPIDAHFLKRLQAVCDK